VLDVYYAVSLKGLRLGGDGLGPIRRCQWMMQIEGRAFNGRIESSIMKRGRAHQDAKAGNWRIRTVVAKEGLSTTA